MKQEYKEKNILDLRHQKYMNYMNITLILIISSFITIVIGTKGLWTLRDIATASMLIVIIILMVILFFETKLSQIKIEILNI